ncbi:MAG: restriction endonuclease subunit S [Bacteroidales bacterium]|nr:restriction endonuclease subunit S [Bacteroidales bacterium]
MSEWKKDKLNTIAQEVRILIEPSGKEIVPYIGLEHISQGDLSLIGQGLSSDAASTKKVFKKGDILFGTLRPYFRKVVRPNFDGVCSTDISVLKAKKGNSQGFLFYLVASQPFIDFASVISNGTKMPRAKWNVLAKTEWHLPEPKEQHCIASILSAYDDLIENNNRRIALLELMAEQFYKEWFVRMRFPGYENTEFEKGVPKGWANIYFRDFIKLNRGFDLPEDKIIEGIYPIVASTSIKAYHNQYKVEAPCIVTGRSGSLGTVQYVNKKAWPLNTSLYVKDFKGNSPQFVFYFLKSIKLENFNCGAGVPTLNQNHLHTLRLFCPSKEIQRKFDDLIIPIFNEVENLQLQTQTLKQTRDLLLPRLISGKLKVNELKEFELV